MDLLRWSRGSNSQERLEKDLKKIKVLTMRERMIDKNWNNLLIREITGKWKSWKKIEKSGSGKKKTESKYEK